MSYKMTKKISVTHSLTISSQGKNCALNAFSLGLIDLLLADDVYRISQQPNNEMIKRFLDLARIKLGLSSATWTALIEHIQSKLTSLQILENEFSALLRDYLVRNLRLDTTESPIQEDFENYYLDYIDNRDGLVRKNRDFGENHTSYHQVTMILDKFREISSQYQPEEPESADFVDNEIDNELLDAATTAVNKWWQKKGFSLYKAYLKQEDSIFSSFELEAIATWLGIKIGFHDHETVKVAESRNSPYLRFLKSSWTYLQDPRYGKLPITVSRNLLSVVEQSFFKKPKELQVQAKLHKRIDTIPDGNCCFNAFTLGFCDLTLAGFLDQFSDSKNYLAMIQLAHSLSIIKGPSWMHFKAFIEASRNDPEYLQKTLALLFRQLATQGYQPETLESSFLAEFRDTIFEFLGLPLQEGFVSDIYLRVPAIREKFDSYREGLELLSESEMDPIFRETLIDSYTQDMKAWWHMEGFRLFKSFMNENGQWAGDIELAYLGDYFHLTIKIKYNAKESCLNQQFGNFELPKHFTAEDVYELQSRGIISSTLTESRAAFEELPKREFETRLTKVKDYDLIVNLFTEKGVNCPINPDWIPELLQRNLIVKHSEVRAGYSWLRNLSLKQLKNRLSAFRHTELMIDIYNQNYSQPPILLFSNPTATHWYYEQSTELEELLIAEVSHSDNPLATKRILSF